ncbi:hypothetical protein quinque_002434 [Culex quinquefasciatus]
MASKTIRKWQFAGGTDTTSGARMVRRGCAGEGVIPAVPTNYTRNWEDEDVYSKSNNVNKHTRPRKSLPRPEEFSELGGGVGGMNNSSNNNQQQWQRWQSRALAKMRRASRQSR